MKNDLLKNELRRTYDTEKLNNSWFAPRVPTCFKKRNNLVMWKEISFIFLQMLFSTKIDRNSHVISQLFQFETKMQNYPQKWEFFHWLKAIIVMPSLENSNLTVWMSANRRINSKFFCSCSFLRQKRREYCRLKHTIQGSLKKLLKEKWDFRQINALIYFSMIF